MNQDFYKLLSQTPELAKHIIFYLYARPEPYAKWPREYFEAQVIASGDSKRVTIHCSTKDKQQAELCFSHFEATCVALGWKLIIVATGYERY